MLRKWKSVAGIVSSAAAVFLVISALTALPVAASRGDIWTQPAGTPEETKGHSQEVHLPCGAVDIWAAGLDGRHGTWVLYHMPPPNPASPQTQVASGSYSYSGEGSEKMATIPLSTLHLATGPHFKVEVSNGENKKSKTFWVDCKVAISTTPNPSTAAVGSTLKDTATLSHGFSPTGTITFTLYSPANVVAHTETVNVSGNGSYSTPAGHVADAVGTWHWKAAYSGNAGNAAVKSNPADEPVVVTKAATRITTTPNPGSAKVGATLKDSATLAGGFSPTGTITFTLLDPGNTAVHTETATVAGNGTYSTATGHVAGVPGTWHWSAQYSGDANNTASTSEPGSEPVTVTENEIVRVQPTITTTAQPAAAVVGATLKDSATLSGGNDPQGSITFTLLDPTGTAAHTEVVPVDGNGTYSTPTGHVAGTVGTWHWKAEYSGDAANKPAASNPADEPVVVTQGENVRVQPTITTRPLPTSTTVGGNLKDIATLGGGSNPKGTIVFTLYNPSGVAVHTEEVTVNGNGDYSTPSGHAAGVAGTWHWKAQYSGDVNNLPASSDPADEPVVVGPEGGVLAATGQTPALAGLALLLVAFGLVAMTGALAWKRHAL